MANYEKEFLRGPTPYESQTVATRYGDTHIVIGGSAEGKPLILFHGWNGNASGIGREFAFLFSSYRVYMPDIVGHSGKSAPHRLPVKGPAYANWARDLLDALKLEQVHIIGISGGGWMTLKFCAYNPQRVLKAVAISSDGLSPANTWGILRWMLPAAIFPNRITTKWFMQFVTSPNGAKTEAFNDFMQGIYSFKDFKTQGPPGLLPDDELRQITCPLLLLMGEDERIFPPQRAIERAKNLIPGLMAAEIVPNAGHVMTIDQPDLLAERVLDFLQKAPVKRHKLHL